MATATETSHIFNRLMADSGLQSLITAIGLKIVKTPGSEDVAPMITIPNESVDYDYHMTGISQPIKHLVSVNIFGRTPAERDQIRSAVEENLTQNIQWNVEGQTLTLFINQAEEFQTEEFEGESFGSEGYQFSLTLWIGTSSGA